MHTITVSLSCLMMIVSPAFIAMSRRVNEEDFEELDQAAK